MSVSNEQSCIRCLYILFLVHIVCCVCVCLAIESLLGDQWGFCHLELIFHNEEYSGVGCV